MRTSNKSISYPIQITGLTLLSLVGCARPVAPEHSGAVNVEVGDQENKTSTTTAGVPDLVSSSFHGVREQTTPRFEITELHHELLSVLSPEMRVPLVGLLNESLGFPQEITPQYWVEHMSEALTAGGMSEQEVPKVLGGYIERGLFRCSQRAEAVRILQRRYPENGFLSEAFTKLPAAETNLPTAGVLFSWTSSAGGNLGLDALSKERANRSDNAWTPENPWDLPINVNLVFDGLMPNYPDQTQPVTSLTGEISGFSDSGQLLWTRELQPITFENPKSDHAYIAAQIHGKDELDGAPIVIRITHEITQRAGEGDTDSPGSRFRGEHWTRFVPVVQTSDPSKKLGYREVPLGLGGQRLEQPSILSSAVFDTVSEILTTNRERLLESFRAKEQEELLRQQLVGRPLSKISLNYDATGAASDVELRRDGTSILVFGATWCGPCGMVAPEIEAFIQKNKNDPRSATVYRFSVDDPDEYAKAVKGKYPDGVIKPEQGEALAVSSVPAYIVIRSGKIAETGVLGPGDIERLATLYK